jgi:hypothetical protein
MKLAEVRAVVRCINSPTKNTAWYSCEDRRIIEELIQLLPPVSENYMVVWQERAVNLESRVATVSQSRSASGS